MTIFVVGNGIRSSLHSVVAAEIKSRFAVGPVFPPTGSGLTATYLHSLFR